MLSTSRRATVRRMLVSGTSSTSSAAAGAGAGAGGAAGAGAARPPSPAASASTSALTTRPPGPLPVTVARSMPRSRAIALAIGEALTGPPAGAAGGAGGPGGRGRGGRAVARPDDRDRLADRDGVPLLDQEPLQHPLLEGLQLHGGLVGLDLGQHVAAVDLVARLLQPGGQGALLHGVGQARHGDLGHGSRTSLASAGRV